VPPPSNRGGGDTVTIINHHLIWYRHNNTLTRHLGQNPTPTISQEQLGHASQLHTQNNYTNTEAVHPSTTTLLYTCVCLCGNATTAAHPTFTQQQSRDTNRADSMHHIPACASASMLYRCPINSTALILVHTPTHCRHFAWKGAAVANSTVGLPYTRCTQLAQNHRASVRTHCYCQHQTHL
jgi:hypothetical protein